MWSDLPDQADLNDRRSARAERQARARRTRLQRLSVTVTTLSLVAVGGVVVLARPAAEVAPAAAVATPSTAAPSAMASQAEQQIREALATEEPTPSTEPTPEASEEPQPAEPAEVTPTVRTAATPEESTDLPAESLPVASEGDYGAVIEVAQRALDVEPTGYFGPKTKVAVTEYQEAVGLPATGQIATFTWSALGAETVEAALKAASGPEGYVAGEPAQIQESATVEVAATPVTAGDPPVLEETDSGEAVAVLQRALGVKPATGYFGPLTSKAVKKFQANNGVPTTGVVATMTWGALGKEIANKVATADATYGTVFGPGAPSSSGGSSSDSSGSSNSGSSSSSGGSSSSGNSNGGNSNSGNSNGGGSNGGSNGAAGGNGKLFCPVQKFTYGDGLGAPRPGGRSHAGLDLMGKRGEPIYAIDSGKVTRSGFQSNGSLILDITGPRGMYFYGHFDKILVGYGESVKAGQLIGYMGDTGSRGAVHLHLEVRKNGWSGGYSDPKPLIKSLCG